MNEPGEMERYQAKTGEERFKQILELEYRFAPRIAESIVAEAQTYLQGQSSGLRVGQMRVLLARQRAAHGRALRETAQVEVTWTVDGGVEDLAVLRQHGPSGLRQVRIQRLLDEAVEQGGWATQEDLARALHTSVRTIKRDYEEMHESGLYLPSRGYLQGIGRGQTHKAQIIRRWLQGETYDQLSSNTRHAVSSIQRYIKAFVQVVRLAQEGLSESQIGLLLQMGAPLVRDYLQVYACNAQPECRQRLSEQMQRMFGGTTPEKGGQ